MFACQSHNIHNIFIGLVFVVLEIKEKNIELYIYNLLDLLREQINVCLTNFQALLLYTGSKYWENRKTKTGP